MQFKPTAEQTSPCVVVNVDQKTGQRDNWLTVNNNGGLSFTTVCHNQISHHSMSKMRFWWNICTCGGEHRHCHNSNKEASVDCAIELLLIKNTNII